MWGRNPDILAGGIGAANLLCPAIEVSAQKAGRQTSNLEQANVCENEDIFFSITWLVWSNLMGRSVLITTTFIIMNHFLMSGPCLARSPTRCIFQNFVTWTPSLYHIHIFTPTHHTLSHYQNKYYHHIVLQFSLLDMIASHKLKGQAGNPFRKLGNAQPSAISSPVHVGPNWLQQWQTILIPAVSKKSKFCQVPIWLFNSPFLGAFFVLNLWPFICSTFFNVYPVPSPVGLCQ